MARVTPDTPATRSGARRPVEPPKARGERIGARLIRTLQRPSVALVVLLIATAYPIVESRHFNGPNAFLTRGGGSTIVGLVLPATDADARTLLTTWHRENVLDCALRTLEIDRSYIWKYGTAGLVIALFGWISLPREWRRGWVVALPLLATLAAGSDLIENRHVEQIVTLASADATAAGCVEPLTPRTLTLRATPELSHEIAVARAFALAKFLLLAGAWCGVLLIAGIHVVRLRSRTDVIDRDDTGQRPPGTFERLHAEELRALLKEGRAPIAAPGSSGEPWIPFRDDDLVGLALSGGGIRSATFNLGLLQGFSRFPGVLPLIDYISTVSGGGYIGGAWSAWLTRQRGSDRTSFFGASSSTQLTETPAIRHLREFSNFLIPRWGLFEVATWQAVVAVVSGVLPGVLSALSLIFLALVVYLLSTAYMATDLPWAGPVQTGVLLLFTLAVFEYSWRRRNSEPDDPSERHEWILQRRMTSGTAIAAAMAAFGIQWSLSRRYPPLSTDAYGAFETWARTLTLAPGVDGWFRLRLFEVSIACGIAALMFFAARLLLSTIVPAARVRAILVGFDRTLMRVLGLSVAFAACAAIWHVGVNLREWTWRLVTAAGGFGVVFALLRNWFTTLTRPQSPGLLDQLKPYIPQVLAYATIVLTAAAMVSVLVDRAGANLAVWLFLIELALTLLTLMLFVDPQATGLHRFYRDRLTRAFAGASNPLSASAADNAQYDPRHHDDVPLDRLQGPPYHLICCAANDLAADQVQSLSRGARSAVLSRHGIAVGNAWAPATDVSLASAITASAAAFNSNMGSVSVKLGPGVTFLMAALNLRLGLWVRDPAQSPTARRMLPGALFYREMFQRTLAFGSDAVHLSDGGHFENLGLYELVRRHCRYIIVSDASADPDVAFDDFGIAARRIRQDFGVEIFIDLSPLKPDADGCARQHMVVGTIDYNGGLDKGILLYVKPALTGDEEPDIRQYRRRNDAFPHESTGDQFYDEAQWESYRRLGDHTAQTILQYVGRLSPQHQMKAGELFQRARSEWYPTTTEFSERVLSMTGRLSQVETELRDTDGATIIYEIFPELRAVGGRPVVRPTDVARAEAANLRCLLLMLQLMEDAYVACELDRLWNHPLNLGWMNLFARWATAPTFQMWWPLLSPMYGSLFLRFMYERFPKLGIGARGAGRIAQEPLDALDGLAWTWWHKRYGQEIPAGATFFSYSISLTRDGRAVPMQVGLAAIRFDDARRVATWTVDHFFVPPSLWNGGLGSEFLRELMAELGRVHGSTLKECRVTMPATPRSGQAGRAEQLGSVEFYKRAGFRLTRSDDAASLELVYRF